MSLRELIRRFRTGPTRWFQEKVRQDQIASSGVARREEAASTPRWISINGTEEEKRGHASGVLPMAEAIARINDQVFAAVDTRPVYVHDGAKRLQKFIRLCTAQPTSWSHPQTLAIAALTGHHGVGREWAAVREIQERLPGRPTLFFVIICCCRGVTRCAEPVVIIGALVTLEHRAVRAAPRVHRVRQTVGCCFCHGRCRIATGEDWSPAR